MMRSTAEAYVAKHGPQLAADLADPSQNRMAVAQRYGLTRSNASAIAKALGIAPRITYVKKTPAYRRDLISDMTTKDIAAKYNASTSTVVFDRRKARGPTKKFVKLTTSVVALLKSSLPVNDVAKAVGMAPGTARQYRRDMTNYTPRKRVRHRLADEDRALILSFGSVAAAVAGTSYSEATIVRVYTTQSIAQGRKGPGPSLRHDFPDDPAWWASRTITQAAKDLRYPLTTVDYYVKTRNIATKTKARQ